MKTTRHRPVPCLECGKEIDSGSGLDHDAAPTPGDIAVCFYCHHVMLYADDLTLRALTDEEILDIAANPELLTVMKALNAYKPLWEPTK